VAMMVKADLDNARREIHLRDGGFESKRYHE
jgi:hypothetical protein